MTTEKPLETKVLEDSLSSIRNDGSRKCPANIELYGIGICLVQDVNHVGFECSYRKDVVKIDGLKIPSYSCSYKVRE